MGDFDAQGKVDRRQFMKLASMVGGGIMLMACAPTAVAPNPTATPATAAKPKVSANINFASTAGGVGFFMMPYLVAQELFLKDEGITEKMTVFGGGGDTVRGIAEGGHQIGHPGPNSVAIAAAEGQPLRIIAENLPFASTYWFVKADSPIKSMPDAKGKKLGYSRPGSISQTMAFTALRSVGLKPDQDVQMVGAGGPAEQLTGVKTGVIDIGWLNDPLLAQELLKKEIRVIASANDFIPNWSETMLTTTVDYAKANGDVLTAYLRAHQKAMDFIKSSPDRAAEIWAKGQDITPDLAKSTMKNYPIQKFTSRIDPAILKAISDDMIANNQLKQPPEWNKIVDQSFLAPELRTQI